ncbi:UNVERIFIED_CONTAM: F-box protein CPR1 [Sesamum radiatum]|uniref:F-box protein CPR1 n=1 Tax=Sesamum radiatum TaxID=300843 RepID=A0AAW2K8R2_SESRA
MGGEDPNPKPTRDVQVQPPQPPQKESERNRPQFGKIKRRKVDRKCVSRSWCSLIGSKEFIKTHLEKSTKNTHFTHHRLVLNFFIPRNALKHCSLQSLLNEPVTDALAFGDPNPENSIWAVGCCNGLICILINRRRFLLWNPSTRMSKRLPDIDEKLTRGVLTKFGFGSDDSGDYKVFAVFSVFWITGIHQATGKVYSLKTNSWRRIKDRDGGSFNEGGKFVSGKLHWSRKSGQDLPWDIVSFDLEREVYGVVELPMYQQSRCGPSLGVLDGCLSMLCDYYSTQLDVWLLKEYGVRESWNKVVTVPYHGEPWSGPFSTPICIGPEGEILVAIRSIFLVYYPKDNWFSRARIVNFDKCRATDVYVESLVSLVSDGE